MTCWPMTYWPTTAQMVDDSNQRFSRIRWTRLHHVCNRGYTEETEEKIRSIFNNDNTQQEQNFLLNKKPKHRIGTHHVRWQSKAATHEAQQKSWNTKVYNRHVLQQIKWNVTKTWDRKNMTTLLWQLIIYLLRIIQTWNRISRPNWKNTLDFLSVYAIF